MPTPPVEHRFKPGVSGNPKGKPKGTRDTKTIINAFFKAKEEMRDPTTGKLKKLSVKQRLILAQISQALKGNTKAFNALMDRVDGKVAQPLQHSGTDGAPLTPTVIQVVGVDGDAQPE